MTPRYTVTTAEFGNKVSSDFSDIQSVVDLENALIDRIIVRYNNYITSLTVHYVGSKHPAIQRGGYENRTNGEHFMNEVVLESDEWITRIEGNYLPKLISGIKFVSNTGRTWGPLFRRKLLKATFAEYARPAIPTGLQKFEIETVVKPIVQSTRAVSAFARQLMSTVITLRIGQDSTEFHVYEVVIRRLPFFQVVLASAPGEAITLPDDQADLARIPIYCAAGIPDSELGKGYFHVAVYAVGMKYECETLVQRAVENFRNVLKQLSGLDVIDLWKAAYLEGLYLSQFEGDDNLHSFMEGLPKLIGDLYGSNREEMENMVAEYPELGCDLLRLISTSHEI
ncbi:hypothetical protein Q9L58_006528 [Maublancomyces gigas]|uniref:Jacalin-type lectin domain-containing protein n=1 Tax=Discina gigas TaxID=1032678 RepID=A0ABR3GFF2_9PEZI